MNTSEMRQVTGKVQLVSDDSESCCLLQIELRACHQVSRCKEVLHFLPNRHLCVHKLFEVNGVANGIDVKLRVLKILDQTSLCSDEHVIKLLT